MQVIINVIDENKGINKKHTVKNKSIKPEYKLDFLNKMSDNNILSSKNLFVNSLFVGNFILQNRIKI